MAFVLPGRVAKADVPHLISYQRVLNNSSGSPVPDGLYAVTFRIYAAPSGGSALWSSGVQMISVTDGLFSYALGSSAPIPDSVFAGGPDRCLGIQVESDPELSPRTRILASAYALQAQGAELAHVFRLVPQGTPGPCDPNGRGNMYYDNVMNELCYCSGSLWVQVDGGGLCE
jgi:hypothetical protein